MEIPFAVPVFLGALGAVGLHLFYRLAYVSWPERYFESSDALSFAISKHLSGYLLFRFGPVVLAMVVVGGFASTSNLGAEVAIATMALLHIAAGPGVSGIMSLRRKPGAHRPRIARLAILTVMSLGVIASGVIAVVMVAVLNVPTPSGSDLLTAIVGALLAAVLINGLKQATHASVTMSEMLEYSRSQLAPNLEPEVKQVAQEVGADPILLTAILHAENLQRPKWLRPLERLKARVFRGGSSGVFQVWSPRPLSDMESARVVADRLKGVARPSTHYSWNENLSEEEEARESARVEGQIAQLERELRRHNSDARFIEMVFNFLTLLENE